MGALSIFPGRLRLMYRNYQRVFALKAEEMVIVFFSRTCRRTVYHYIKKNKKGEKKPHTTPHAHALDSKRWLLCLRKVSKII
jgi:hypothetical protein